MSHASGSALSELGPRCCIVTTSPPETAHLVGLFYAGGAQVAEIALGGGDRNPRGRVRQHGADRLRLFHIATAGAQAVGVYVAAQNLAILPGLFGNALAPILMATMTRERAMGEPNDAGALASARPPQAENNPRF